MTENFFIKKYIIRNACLILGIAFFIFMIFFVVALIYDVLEDDILISLKMLGVGTLIFAVSLVPIKRFRDMIRMQEAMFDIRFHGEDALPLHRNSLVYLSDNWLIIAGQYAFYRSFIKNNRIKIHVQSTNRGNNYLIKIDGINDQSYCFHADSASSAKKIKAWSKTEESLHDIN